MKDAVGVYFWSECGPHWRLADKATRKNDLSNDLMWGISGVEALGYRCPAYNEDGANVKFFYVEAVGSLVTDVPKSVFAALRKGDTLLVRGESAYVSRRDARGVEVYLDSSISYEHVEHA